jgi:hypothetical protein
MSVATNQTGLCQRPRGRSSDNLRRFLAAWLRSRDDVFFKAF